jgi:predicted amidohydrolase YtcJ
VKVDQIHVNGVVHTMDPGNSTVEGFAVSGGRFCFVGSSEEAMRLAGPGTEVHDLGGRTVLPGFIETHSHLSLHAITLRQANCRTPPNATIDDVKAGLRESATGKEPGQWIRGWGFDDTLIEEKRHLTRWDLDEAVPLHPVYVSHTSGHLAYVNSAALRMAGIGPTTPQPAGGEIHMDSRGEPTGLLAEEPAQRLVLELIPPYPVSALRESMAKSMGVFHRAGITSIHDAAIGYFRQHKPILQAYREMETSGRLHIRVYLTIVEEVYRNLLEVGLGTGFGSEYLKLGAVNPT